MHGSSIPTPSFLEQKDEGKTAAQEKIKTPKEPTKK